jgi:mediator of RNA polymerase II transcription subunit 5
VYDEFAAVLLLVIAFFHRFKLGPHDIGVPPSSFVSQYLSKGHVGRRLDDLSEADKKNLNSWITGLFNPDGITDEVLAQCRPQDMYLLVPTITSQAVTSVTQQVLDINTVKQGLDCKSS